MLPQQEMSNSSPVTDCFGLLPGIAFPVPSGAEEIQSFGLRSCLGHAFWQDYKCEVVWTFRASMLHREGLLYLLEVTLGANVS
jgi:hypothetical protein